MNMVRKFAETAIRKQSRVSIKGPVWKPPPCRWDQKRRGLVLLVLFAGGVAAAASGVVAAAAAVGVVAAGGGVAAAAVWGGWGVLRCNYAII